MLQRPVLNYTRNNGFVQAELKPGVSVKTSVCVYWDARHDDETSS